MKKTVMLIALFVGFMGFSQENSTYKTDALKLVKLTKEAKLEVMLEPIKNKIPSENREAFMNDVRATYPDLFSQIAEFYMEAYSHDEIKGLLNFYATPLGQKMLKNVPEITQKTMGLNRSWGLKLRPLIQKHAG